MAFRSLCNIIHYILAISVNIVLFDLFLIRCMKASIMLDGECLDSRIKISTMLMEMDELDKVHSRLFEASPPHQDGVEILVLLTF